MTRLWLSSGLLLVLALASHAVAQERVVVPYGVTREQSTLIADLDRSMLDVGSVKSRVLLIGGTDGKRTTTEAVNQLVVELQKLVQDEKAIGERISISSITQPYPHGLAAPLAFPPTAKAYDDVTQPESIYLWRWLGMLAPDMVIELVPGEQFSVTTAKSQGVGFQFIEFLHPQRESNSQSFIASLCQKSPGDVAPVGALRVQLAQAKQLLPVLNAFAEARQKSPARVELARRRQRSPIEVARELAGTYGQQLNEVAYIPALSLVGRVRLGMLTNDESQLRDVQRIVQPYLTGEKKPAKANGSQHAGHLVFGELLDSTGDKNYLPLIKAVADLGFDDQGRMREAMPSHSEMSDAVFMAPPILAQTARLSGDAKYRDMAIKHLRFMVKLNQRPDGLHQHSPLAPDHTAWGRGNGFVTLGLVLALSEWPASGPEYEELLKLYREHLAAMLKHQDELGMWHQVVDHPESYREFTVTCMTTFSIARGLRRGWLERATFEPVVRRAWPSINQRIGLKGSLVDVCTGTGKMKSLREYLDRPAILGKDDRGGAMAFLVSTELAFAEREGKLSLNP